LDDAEVGEQERDGFGGYRAAAIGVDGQLSDVDALLGVLLLQRVIRSLRASRRGRPRGADNPASASASQARRHPTVWLEYKPSRRNSVPFSPSGAAS
jgi:hypothetical protein